MWFYWSLELQVFKRIYIESLSGDLNIDIQFLMEHYYTLNRFFGGKAQIKSGDCWEKEAINIYEIAKSESMNYFNEELENLE